MLLLQHFMKVILPMFLPMANGIFPPLSIRVRSAANPMSLAGAVPVLADLQIDVMVPQMYCLPGMTQYRALFELLNIPYLGNTSEVMALTADKAKTKAVVASWGKCATGRSSPRGRWPVIDFPVVVKPVNADNSLGVALVKNAADYDAALQTALTHLKRKC